MNQTTGKRRRIASWVAGVLLATAGTIAWRFIRPLRTHDGSWHFVVVETYESPPGHKVRSLVGHPWGWYLGKIPGVQVRLPAGMAVRWEIRHEYDWDGDGTFDCRWEQQKMGRKLWHRQDGEWVAVPAGPVRWLEKCFAHDLAPGQEQ
ncbi:hypothetical protein [Archangium sp.]|jgi:hypothetical protein|uniref:hypothetical protein n=1 Tax=Archangium sp. TaxID=1872627 RepID=UPI002EDAAC25